MATDAREQAELRMDRLLGIRTCGRDETGAGFDDAPYEPTPYPVLDRVAASGLVVS